MLTNIETERVRKGLTQEQIASQLGVSHKTYYNWINEKKDIPSQKLKKMSQMFKTNMYFSCRLEHFHHKDIKPFSALLPTSTPCSF